MPRRRNRRRSAKRARGSSDRRGCRSRRRAWDGAFSTDHPIARISHVTNVSNIALFLHRRARGRRPLISQLIDVSIKLAKDVANLLKCFLRRPHNAPPYLLQFASAENARELPPLKKRVRPHIACDTCTAWVKPRLVSHPTTLVDRSSLHSVTSSKTLPTPSTTLANLSKSILSGVSSGVWYHL